MKCDCGGKRQAKNDSGERNLSRNSDGPMDHGMFIDPRSSLHLAAMHGPFNHPAGLLIMLMLQSRWGFSRIYRLLPRIYVCQLVITLRPALGELNFIVF
jgi:hypothetical protein